MNMIILIYPPSLINSAESIEVLQREGIASPISIEHSLINCGRCDEQGWIGPKQRQAANAGAGEVVCFYCLTADPEIPEVVPMISLNADIDDVPRRLT